MKKYSFLFLLLLSVFTFQACNNGSDNQDSVDSADNMNEMKDSDANQMNGMDTMSMSNMDSTMRLSEDDAEFMVKAAAGGMAEVEFSKLAQDKATNADVKTFAAMMVTDHTRANDEAKAFATARNVSLPAEMDDSHKKDYDDLSKKTGKDFDKAYVKAMVSDHKKTVDMFKDQSDDKEINPDLKAWIDKTLPTLQAHLDQAKKLDDTMKK